MIKSTAQLAQLILATGRILGQTRIQLVGPPGVGLLA
jgi:hypothetical protein